MQAVAQTLVCFFLLAVTAQAGPYKRVLIPAHSYPAANILARKLHLEIVDAATHIHDASQQLVEKWGGL